MKSLLFAEGRRGTLKIAGNAREGKGTSQFEKKTQFVFSLGDPGNFGKNHFRFNLDLTARQSDQLCLFFSFLDENKRKRKKSESDRESSEDRRKFNGPNKSLNELESVTFNPLYLSLNSSQAHLTASASDQPRNEEEDCHRYQDAKFTQIFRRYV